MVLAKVSLYCTDSDRWFRGSADGGEDIGHGLCSDERSGALVVLGDVAFDGHLQIDDAGEGASLQPTTGQR